MARWSSSWSRRGSSRELRTTGRSRSRSRSCRPRARSPTGSPSRLRMAGPVTDVLSAVIDLIEQVTDVPVETIRADSRFETLGQWTSFAALRLLVSVEERFGIQLELGEYLSLAS